MDNQKPTIAAFDFDGTLTYRDSLLPFLLFDQGSWQFTLKMIRVSPVLAAYAFKLIRNDRAKEILLKTFLGGRSLSEIEASGGRFAATQIQSMLKPEAWERFLWHKSQGHVCVLVSASLVHYLVPWASKAGFDHVIGSSLATDDQGVVSGKLHGGNCYGDQKAKRIREWLGGTDAIVYAYGDSRGDRELLAMADHPFYRTMPRGELR